MSNIKETVFSNDVLFIYFFKQGISTFDKLFSYFELLADIKYSSFLNYWPRRKYELKYFLLKLIYPEKKVSENAFQFPPN